jgi:uncharacterized protein (TIGR03435 family)
VVTPAARREAVRVAGEAYGHTERLPEWATFERYDIEARIPSDKLPTDEYPYLRALLEDRFQLHTHFENQDQPIYALMVQREGQLGPGLRPSVDAFKARDENDSTAEGSRHTVRDDVWQRAPARRGRNA